MTTYTSEDFRKAEFARRPDGCRAVAHGLRSGSNRWTVDCHGLQFSDAEMAEGRWVPVRDVDQHLRDRTVDLVAAIEDRDKARRERDTLAERVRDFADSIRQEQESNDRLRRRAERAEQAVRDADQLVLVEQARADKAEQERDDARAMSSLWRETTRRALRDRNSWRSAARIGEHTSATLAERVKNLRTQVQDWEARAEKAERSCRTLGKSVEDQCRDIARITRSEHMVDADGDADWGAIWERGHEMADRLEKAEQERDSWETIAQQTARSIEALRAEQPRPLPADDDERIQAWYQLVEHPAWEPCYPEERALIDSMMDRLDGLVEAEQAHRQMPDVTDEEQYEEGLRQAGRGRADDFDRLTVWLMGAGWARKRLAPARPEGAERFDPIVDAAIRGHSDITSPAVVHAIADALAEEGARAPGAES